MRSQVDRFCAELRHALTPVLAQPMARVQPPKTRKTRQKRPPPTTTPRRSVRIARGVGRGSKASKQQNVLIRKLCLANEEEVIGDEALEAYVVCLTSPSQIATLEQF